MNNSKVKYSIRILIAAFLLFVTGLVIWNLDVVLRFVHAYQNGSLTLEKMRFDIAAFNLGRRPPILPVGQKTSTADGMTQLYVPEGEFVMGANHNHDFPDFPAHFVYLDAFWMDKVEVTNAMYLKCMKAKLCTVPATDNTLYDQWIYRDHPIVYVAWSQANQYCQWAGRRLPTEAEWEKAGRGTDERKYPWGNEDPTPRLANFSDGLIGESVSSYRYLLGASPYGVLNMAGNVREWVSDWYDPDYYSHTPAANPKGPETGTERSLRSASYNEGAGEIVVSARLRHEPECTGLSRGFRCAQDAIAGNQ